MRALKTLLLAATACATLGCAGQYAPPVLSNTRLGKVIIYRNGVSYFERYAPPGEEAITLRVPAERVDDFLKSLSIVDEKTGKAMPVSYPTLDAYEGYATMTIKLPKTHGRLRIIYVTESPAWKPSYRVVLDEGGKARLQGWAVVDNVSGEDWTHVRIGVGSTSALSFRYDLHSVRLVERANLSTGAALAAAPPTGGSPYAVATRKVRVLGNISAADLAMIQTSGSRVDGETAATASMDFEMDEMEPPADAGDSGGSSSRSRRGSGKKNLKKKPRHDYRYFQSMSQRLQGGQHRVRIEGFAQAGDGDRKQASLARANAMRDQLVSMGVPAGNIDVVGTGVMNRREAVRVLETEQTANPDTAGQVAKAEAEAADTQPVGHAHFVSKAAMSIEADHSAMVSILNQITEAQRVYYYDPVSARGSKKYAFNAVRIRNPSPYTLDSGPFTIYADKQFLGEGLADPILPGSLAFIPDALDRTILADPEVKTREEIERLLTIQRGIITTETRRIRSTKLTLTNRSKRDAKVFVRHKVGRGFNLDTKSEKKTAKVAKLAGAHLFPVDVQAGEAVELIIEEWTPLMKTVDIRTTGGIKDITLFLKKGPIEPGLKEKLSQIVQSYTATANLQQRINLLDEQMAVYRQRVDEINVQLVTLRKVPQAARLRRHLAKKMEEISDRLQQATMEMTDLKGQQMTLRIELQDKLAELTLEREDDEAKQATN
jgi:hypothetical protein